MPTWKYQSILPNGVRVFGVFDADDQTALASYLATRGMTLVEATELSIHSALTADTRELPRMVQLRVGERLREALLTDLPAHQAIRAIAEEPFEHPLVMLMPWFFSIAVFASIVLLCLRVAIPESTTTLVAAAVAVPLLTGLLWFVMAIVLVRRPRELLLTLADRVERGGDAHLQSEAIGPELKCLLNAPLDSRTKVASMAELIPELSNMRLQSHRFAMSMLGPALAMSVLFLGLHAMLLTIVPQFKDIFEGFGVELPGMTQMLMAISDGVGFFGYAGLACMTAVMVGILFVVYSMLVWPRAAEVLEPVPLVGMSIRWQMQARVARILSVLLRNEAPPDVAVAIAAQASGYPMAAADGQAVAERMRKGDPAGGYLRRLSGLPLGLLFRPLNAGVQNRQHQQSAEAFATYATSLEQASSGQAAMLAVIVEVLCVVAAAFLIGLFVMAMFMPLIKLLNDLAVIALPLKGIL